MKIYPKQLNSLEELKRERSVLLYAKKHTASNDFFPTAPLKEKLAPAATPAVDESTDVMAVIGDLLTSRSASSMAMTLGLPLIKMVGLKAGKGILKPIFKEVLGGYIKWKLLHFGYTTVKGMVQSKKEHDTTSKNGKHKR